MKENLHPPGICTWSFLFLVILVFGCNHDDVLVWLGGKIPVFFRKENFIDFMGIVVRVLWESFPGFFENNIPAISLPRKSLSDTYGHRFKDIWNKFGDCNFRHVVWGGTLTWLFLVVFFLGFFTQYLTFWKKPNQQPTQITCRKMQSPNLFLISLNLWFRIFSGLDHTFPVHLFYNFTCKRPVIWKFPRSSDIVVTM